MTPTYYYDIFQAAVIGKQSTKLKIPQFSIYTASIDIILTKLNDEKRHHFCIELNVEVKMPLPSLFFPFTLSSSHILARATFSVMPRRIEALIELFIHVASKNDTFFKNESRAHIFRIRFPKSNLPNFLFYFRYTRKCFQMFNVCYIDWSLLSYLGKTRQCGREVHGDREANVLTLIERLTMKLNQVDGFEIVTYFAECFSNQLFLRMVR